MIVVREKREEDTFSIERPPHFSCQQKLNTLHQKQFIQYNSTRDHPICGIGLKVNLIDPSRCRLSLI